MPDAPRPTPSRPADPPEPTPRQPDPDADRDAESTADRGKDPMAPSTSVDDEHSDEAVEPNEPA